MWALIGLFVSAAGPIASESNAREDMPYERVFFEPALGFSLTAFPALAPEAQGLRFGPTFLARMGTRSRVAELYAVAEHTHYAGASPLSLSKFGVGVGLRYDKGSLALSGTADVGMVLAASGVAAYYGAGARLSFGLDWKPLSWLSFGPCLTASLDLFTPNAHDISRWRAVVGATVSARVAFLF